MSSMQRHALAIDHSAGMGIAGYLGLVKAVADGAEPMPTMEEPGARYGQAVDACHRALSIPELARETYRESSQLGGRRKN
jgi:hypothetical protein